MSRLLSHRFLLIVVVVLVAAGGVLVGLDLSGVFSDDDVQTTDQPIPAPIPGNGPTGPLHKLWTVQADAVAPAGGQVLTSTSYDVTARDVHTGAVRWSYRRTDRRALVGAAVTDSTVVAGFAGFDAEHGYVLVGLDAAHGTKLWSRDGLRVGLGNLAVAERLDASVAVGDTVYADQLTDAGITVLALDPRTGDSRWQTSLGPGCVVAPAGVMASGLGVAVTAKCRSGTTIFARTFLVDPAGRLRWHRDLPLPDEHNGNAAMVVGMGDGMVAVGTVAGPGAVYSAAGDVVGPCVCSVDVLTEPVGTSIAGLVLTTGYPANSQHLTTTAYDGSTGRQRWSTTLAGTPYAGLAAHLLTSGPGLFAGAPSLKYPLLALDPATGALRGTYGFGGGQGDIGVAALDGGAFLALDVVGDPDELTAYAS